MKPLLEVLQGCKKSFPPCWFMRQAGRHLEEYRLLRSQKENFLDFCLSPALAAQATLQPLQRYELDAAIIFSDILVIPYALGQKVEFVEHKGPVLEALSTPESIYELNWEKTDLITSRVCETLEIVKSRLDSSAALLGFAGAPWTLACYMIEGGSSKDFNKAKIFALRWPKAFRELLDLLAEVTAEYLSAQIEAGAEALQLFDSWAGRVPALYFQDWVIKPTQKIIAKLKKSYSHIPVIGFPRGCGSLYKNYYEMTGVNAISLDETLDLDWMRNQLGDQAIIQGALDPALLIVGGKLLEREVERQINILNTGPYIFNLGHGILPETPPENVEYLIRQIRKM